jgi:hypothetical protein
VDAIALLLYTMLNFEARKWTHLDEYERKYLQQAMQAYDEIMQNDSDIFIIASRYQLSVEDVQRAKDYAFGRGVSQRQFSPDSRMAEAWQRMALNQGNRLDEILLRHEVYKSDLVTNQDLSQTQAHQLAQTLYPWSNFIN